MAPEDAGEGFKVTDRRRRDPDTESSAADAPSIEREGAGRGATDAPQARPARGETVRTERPGGGRPVVESVDARAGRDLTGLFVMLAGSAAMALGEAPDPLSGQVEVDLPQASELIDLLVLLREKTEGHRTPEESQVLDAVIYDLQVRYVAATRRAG